MKNLALLRVSSSDVPAVDRTGLRIATILMLASADQSRSVTEPRKETIMVFCLDRSEMRYTSSDLALLMPNIVLAISFLIHFLELESLFT